MKICHGSKLKLMNFMTEVCLQSHSSVRNGAILHHRIRLNQQWVKPMRKDATLNITDYIKTGLALAALGGFVLVSIPTSADARPNTRSYTCEGLKDLIYDRGAVVMNWKGNSVFERFVDNRSFCKLDETLRYRSVPTRTGKCRLRYCKPAIFFKRD